MPNEELIQRGYYVDSKIIGQKFGNYEILEIGQTNINELKKVGLISTTVTTVDFPFKYYTPPKRIGYTKPDTILINRVGDKLNIVATKENKRPVRI